MALVLPPDVPHQPECAEGAWLFTGVALVVARAGRVRALLCATARATALDSAEGGGDGIQWRRATRAGRRWACGVFARWHCLGGAISVQGSRGAQLWPHAVAVLCAEHGLLGVGGSAPLRRQNLHRDLSSHPACLATGQPVQQHHEGTEVRVRPPFGHVCCAASAVPGAPVALLPCAFPCLSLKNDDYFNTCKREQAPSSKAPACHFTAQQSSKRSCVRQRLPATAPQADKSRISLSLRRLSLSLSLSRRARSAASLLLAVHLPVLGPQALGGLCLLRLLRAPTAGPATPNTAVRPAGMQARRAARCMPGGACVRARRAPQAACWGGMRGAGSGCGAGNDGVRYAVMCVWSAPATERTRASSGVGLA